MAGQRVTVKAAVFVIDDEWFGGDEEEHELVFGDVIVGNDDVPLQLLKSHIGVGGEVRAELELFARREGSASVHIDGIARFFEGTSESTSDLEDSQIISLTVPLSQTVDHSFELKNFETGEFGRSHDRAKYDLQFRNVPAGVILTSGGDLYASLPKQDQWRHCFKCRSLWFSGRNGAGRCPAGGGHSLDGSGNYMVVDAVNFPGGQPNWRFCHKCLSLWFGGANQAGRCAGGGGHSLDGSANYVLTGATDVPGQRGWRWCKLCMGLWFSGKMGRCPSGGGHSLVGSGDYVLTEQILGWSGVHSLGGRFHPGDSIAALTRKPGQVELFARGMNNRVWQNSWAGTEWTGWFETAPGAEMVGNPGVFSLAPDHAQIVFIGTDRQAWTSWWPK